MGKQTVYFLVNYPFNKSEIFEIMKLQVKWAYS